MSKDVLTAPMQDTDHRVVAGVKLDIAPAGLGRVKRAIYPAGFKWSTNMKPHVGTELCMHAHIGFLARGEVHVRYADGCTLELKAPAAMAIEPEHDAWVVGSEPAVVIEFDFEKKTCARFGLPETHDHGAAGGEGSADR